MADLGNTGSDKHFRRPGPPPHPIMSDKPKKKKNLSLKEHKFVEEYIENGGNATQAVVKSYDTTTYGSANAIAGKVLNKEHIQAAIHERLIEAKDSASATLGNSLAVAIKRAQEVLQDPCADPRVIAQQQKFILECQKYLDDENKTTRTGPQNEVILVPKR